MTPELAAVYDELLSRAAAPPHAAHSESWRSNFDERCGRVDPEHPEAGRRAAARWEDTLVSGGVARALLPELADPSERELAQQLLDSLRSVFQSELFEDRALVSDLWSGATYVLDPRDDVARTLRVQLEGGVAVLWQGRLLATEDGCVVLPGTLFHPTDALPHIQERVADAQASGQARDDLLDALLRAECAFRSLSRVKVAYAYRR